MSTQINPSPSTWTVRRSLWSRGSIYSALLIVSPPERAGQMCCLGHRCLAQGFEPYQIKNIQVPSGLISTYYNQDWLFDTPSQADVAYYSSIIGLESSKGMHDSWQILIANVNDSDAISDSLRETLLTRIFASHGETLTFID